MSFPPEPAPEREPKPVQRWELRDDAGELIAHGGPNDPVPLGIGLSLGYRSLHWRIVDEGEGGE